jgi:hypothetical protein
MVNLMFEKDLSNTDKEGPLWIPIFILQLVSRNLFVWIDEAL